MIKQAEIHVGFREVRRSLQHFEVLLLRLGQLTLLLRLDSRPEILSRGRAAFHGAARSAVGRADGQRILARGLTDAQLLGDFQLAARVLGPPLPPVKQPKGVVGLAIAGVERQAFLQMPLGFLQPALGQLEPAQRPIALSVLMTGGDDPGTRPGRGPHRLRTR